MPDYLCVDRYDKPVLVIEAFSPEEAIAFYRHGLEDEGKPELGRVAEVADLPAGKMQESFARLLGSPEKGRVAAQGRSGALAGVPRVRASVGSQRVRLSEVKLASATERLVEHTTGGPR